MLVHLLKSGLSWIIRITAPLAIAIAWDGNATEEERKPESILNITDLPSSAYVNPGAAWANTASQSGHKLIRLRILQSDQLSCAGDPGTTVDGSYGDPVASASIKVAY